jgi:hypothetical protein
MNSITSENVLKETKHELEMHIQEHTDQQEVCNNSNADFSLCDAQLMLNL